MSHPVYPPGGRGNAPSSASGLHDQQYEHDACGVGFVARLHAPASHEVVERALDVLNRMEHRGAEGADPETGDGAGILIQVPDAFLRAEVDFELPEPGRYGVAMCFLPPRGRRAQRPRRVLERAVEARACGCSAGARSRSTPSACGRPPRASAPHTAQLFAGAPEGVADQDALERKLYVARRIAEHEGVRGFAIPSFSSRTITYKGMLIAPQLPRYFPDLQDERVVSRLALVHSRFSTNTFPSWELAHPYRMLAHNGEINTVRGNRNWMRAREAQLSLAAVRRRAGRPRPGARRPDVGLGSLDAAFELLTLGGRSLAHAISMLIPEAYQGRGELPQPVNDFFAYHASLIEPWDGPAAVAFTDGRAIGATLDRNGLRPGRWLHTHDGWVVFASETGVLPMPEEVVVGKGRLHPGKLFLVDLERERVVPDAELKRELAARQPYGDWLAERVVKIEDLPDREPARAARRAAAGAPARLRLEPGGPARAARADGARRRRADRLDGQRHRARGAVGQPRRRCSPTSSSCSPRSPTRRSTRSASRS